MTLGDFSTNSKSNGKGTYTDGWNPDMDFLYFIDTSAKMGKPYYNVPQWMIDEVSDWEGYEAGWYIYGDDEYICRNDTKVAFGEGIIVKSSSAAESKNPSLVVNGQVKAVGKDIPVTKFIAVAACRPSTVKLGDITTNSESNGKGTYTNGWNPDTDFLYTIDTNAKMGKPLYNVPQWMIEEVSDWEGYDAGWYIYGDDDYICQNNLQSFEAGTGFIVKSSSAAEGKEPTITIKSALAK